jgi:hypothetical protein
MNIVFLLFVEFAEFLARNLGIARLKSPRCVKFSQGRLVRSQRAADLLTSLNRLL